MGFFSKMKKKLKKLKISSIAKAVKKAGKNIAKAGDFLPAPIGTVAKGLGKLAEKIHVKKSKKESSSSSSSNTPGSLMSRIKANPESNSLFKQVKNDVKKIKKIVR